MWKAVSVYLLLPFFFGEQMFRSTYVCDSFDSDRDALQQDLDDLTWTSMGKRVANEV